LDAFFFLDVSQLTVSQAAFELYLVSVLKTIVLRSSLAIVLLVKNRKAHQRHAVRRSADE